MNIFYMFRKKIGCVVRPEKKETPARSALAIKPLVLGWTTGYYFETIGEERDEQLAGYGCDTTLSHPREKEGTMAPEITSAMQTIPPSATTTAFSRTNTSDAQRAARNLRQAQAERQDAAQRTRDAQAEEQQAQKNLQAAQEEERQAENKVASAQEERQQATRPAPSQATGKKINVLV